MAKIFKIEKTEYKNSRTIITGSIGQHENGLACATADYINPGGLAHHPAQQEMGVMIPISPNRYHIVLGCETHIELEEGESAFFSISEGQVQAKIIAKKDGKLELCDATDEAVLHTPLKQFIEDFKVWANTHSHPNHGTPPASLFTGDLDAKSKDVKLS